MSDSGLPLEELRALADAACDGTLEADDAARLEELLRGNPEAQRFYLARVHLDGALRWEFGHQAQGEGNEEKGEGRREKGEEGKGAKRSGFVTQGAGFEGCPSPIILADLDRSYLSSLSSSVLFSYVMFALLVGVGILTAWTWQTQDDRGLARVADNAPAVGANTSEKTIVGKVVQTTECRWANPSDAAKLGDAVTLGRKFVLTAGSLEIAYNNGAKVTLQGPGIFLVDSSRGGFLSSGRLVARGDGPERPGGRESEEYKSALVKQPFLCIRVPNPVAPMILAADRAAEFRVSIEKPPTTSIYLVRGVVVARLAHNGPLKERSLPDIGATVTAGENATYRFEMFSSAPANDAHDANKTAPTYSAEKKAKEQPPENEKAKGRPPAS
jgi:hypothetical protein